MSLAGLLPHGAEDFGDQTEIVLSGRQIDDTVVRAIAEELKTNRTLTVLDLQSNYITAGGAAQLCDALRLNRSLKELGLANNSLGDEGAAELSNLLDTNHTLERISLDNNAISPALMEKVMFKTLLNTQPLAVKLAMPRALANDPELKELDLSEYEGHSPLPLRVVQARCLYCYNVDCIYFIIVLGNSFPLPRFARKPFLPPLVHTQNGKFVLRPRIWHVEETPACPPRCLL